MRLLQDCNISLLFSPSQSQTESDTKNNYTTMLPGAQGPNQNKFKVLTLHISNSHPDLMSSAVTALCCSKVLPFLPPHTHTCAIGDLGTLEQGLTFTIRHARHFISSKTPPDLVLVNRKRFWNGIEHWG